MDKEQIKKTITEKLPEVLPKAVKWVINHIIMFIFHFRMPIWVTAVKAGKSVKTFKNGKTGVEEENDGETYRRSRHRMCQRRRSRFSKREI